MRAEDLAAINDIIVIQAQPKAIEIDTPQYATFTNILCQIITIGGRISGIAGNDEIMITVTGFKRPVLFAGIRLLASLERRGYSDNRWLVNVQLKDLHTIIRALERSHEKLEHIFDY